MNFDDFKAGWKTGDENSKELEIDIPTKSSHPIYRLKRNLLYEFMLQIFGLLFTAFFPLLFGFEPLVSKIYFAIYGIVIAIASYYLFTFRKFYTNLGSLHLDSFHSLFSAYVELQIFVERYKAFAFSMIPFGLITLLLAIFNKYYKLEMLEKLASDQKIFAITLLLIGITAVFMTIATIWCQLMYEKYIKQLKSLIEDLKM